MAYYHILKQRRMDLHLSIEYVSSQTRLAPEYIQAIEEHNLDVFSDDFSFVRYFVRAYCDAIGVNWQVVSNEVDADIENYARMRSMALSQAQKKMVRQMPNARSSRNVKRNSRSGFQKSVSSISRNIQWKNNRKIKRWLIIGTCCVAVFVLANLWLDARSASLQSQQEQARQEELREKEEETDRLAKQRQEERESEELSFEAVSGLLNTYQISNVLETTKSFTISIELPESTTILLYQDGELMEGWDDVSLHTGTFEEEIEVSKECQLTLEITDYVPEGTTIKICNKEVTFDATYWEEGQPCTITIDIISNETATTRQEEAVQEQEYDLYSQNMYMY